MRMRTLITGGAGFIGSHLAARCVDRGDDVHILARRETSLHRLAGIEGRMTVHRLDMQDRAQLRECLEAIRPRRVFHLATETRPVPNQSPEMIASKAIGEVRNLLLLVQLLSELSDPPEVVVRGGSIAEYGPLPTPFRENQVEAPETPYAIALAAGTDCLRQLQRGLAFPVITARLALVYGPMQSESFMVPALIRRCLDGEPFTVARPKDRRDLLYIDDAVEGLCRLAQTPLGEDTVVNISTGIAPAMGNVARLIVEATGADPAQVAFNDTQHDDEISDLCCSSDLAREAIGWTARTPLAKGIEKTVAWMRAQCLTEA